MEQDKQIVWTWGRGQFNIAILTQLVISHDGDDDDDVFSP